MLIGGGPQKKSRRYPLPADNSTMERSWFRLYISLLKCSILFYDGKHSIVLYLINATTTTYIQRASTFSKSRLEMHLR